ncbi:MAG: type IV toxin-antitoxin system AbiEi family antitoxin domain-containing protein [Thermoplasmata archaeon]
MKERDFLELAGREPVITARQVAAILGDRRYSKVYLHRLVKRGLIRRLKRGFYTVYDDPVVYATYIYHPSYISLWYAFHHHGTTTQLPRLIEVMTSRNGAIEEIEYIRTRDLWGYHTLRYGGFEVFMADLEKAVIDAVVTERLPLDEIQAAVRECNLKRLEEYALRTDLSTIKKVGYVAETAGHFMEALYDRIKGDRNYVRFFAAEKGNRWRVVGD